MRSSGVILNQTALPPRCRLEAKLARLAWRFTRRSGLSPTTRQRIRHAGFLDIFLHHDVGFQPHKGLAETGFCRLARSAHDHANALVPSSSLIHQRRAIDHADQGQGYRMRVRKAG